VVEVRTEEMTDIKTLQEERSAQVIANMKGLISEKAFHMREYTPYQYCPDKPKLAGSYIQSGRFWLELMWKGIKHNAQRRRNKIS
jgi:hypothetical protein